MQSNSTGTGSYSFPEDKVAQNKHVLLLVIGLFHLVIFLPLSNNNQEKKMKKRKKKKEKKVIMNTVRFSKTMTVFGFRTGMGNQQVLYVYLQETCVLRIISV